MDMRAFEDFESEVRSYCRGWPTVFSRARGSRMWDEQDRSYLDFFAGAGSLNYGHNPPVLQEAVVEYLSGDNIVHGLDMMTTAKRRFLETFHEVILEPRGLDYRVQFPGPTGTNAVEAALKLARKVTNRELMIGFTNAFHGMSLGSLSVTGNAMKRGGAGVPLVHATRMPYCNYLDEGSSLAVMESFLEDSGSGLDRPAGVIVEVVQGEGGLNSASASWLQRLEQICRTHEMLLIVDDIQMGVGRTGPFFSFESAGITPDVVCLSKSISGYGMPLSLTLFKPEHDVWGPGEHNGTFRGFNPGFVTAAAAFDHFWRDDKLQIHTSERADQLERSLKIMAERYAAHGTEVKGRGLARGLAFEDPEVTSSICSAAFDNGLLVETSGAESEVVKLMPALTISDEELEEGLDLLDRAVASVVGGERALSAAESGGGS